MRWQWRRLRTGEPDYELIFLLVTSAAAMGAIVWLRLGLPWPECNFRALFGIPCLTCGSTRALLALAQGNFALAWHLNPLATVAMCGIALYDVYALAVLATRAMRLRVALPRNVVLPALVAAALLNWFHLLRTL